MDISISLWLLKGNMYWICTVYVSILCCNSIYQLDQQLRHNKLDKFLVNAVTHSKIHLCLAWMLCAKVKYYILCLQYIIQHEFRGLDWFWTARSHRRCHYCMVPQLDQNRVCPAAHAIIECSGVILFILIHVVFLHVYTIIVVVFPCSDKYYACRISLHNSLYVWYKANHQSHRKAFWQAIRLMYISLEVCCKNNYF